MCSWIDLAVISAYLVGTTILGSSFYFRKGSGDAKTFMAGGGRIPGWALALSIFATYVSSISFLALPAKAYLTTWWAVQSVLSGGMLGLFLLGAFARQTRRKRVILATVLGLVAVLWIVEDGI